VTAVRRTSSVSLGLSGCGSQCTMRREIAVRAEQRGASASGAKRDTCTT
jgi:hypothetical protein